MSRGPRQHQGGQSGGGGGQQSQQNIRRGNKTLGWYLGGLMPEESNGGGGAEEVEEHLSTHQQQQAMRKASLEDARMSPKFANGAADVDLQKKLHLKQAHRFGQQQATARPRANSSASAGKKPLAGGNQFGGQSGKEQQSLQQQIEFHNNNKLTAGGGKGQCGKENYWYYDPLSDGYYYEHNGTRGWRKRNAKVDAAVQAVQKGIEEAKMAEQQKRMAEKSSTNAPVPSLLSTQQQQLGKLAAASTNSAGGIPMAIKYFDNDGYFYEMASVDGWRRRQPGTTPPNSLASSLGAQPKAPSPIPTAAPRRKIQPLQYQAYQQAPPQLNTLDLREMMALTQQQQQHGRNTQSHQTCCCAQQQQQYFAANSPPTRACYCTIAAMAAQLVLQKQQQMIEQSDLGCKSVRPLIEGLSKASTHSSGPFSQSRQPAAPASLSAANWQFPRGGSGKWAPLALNGGGTVAPKAAPTAVVSEEKTTAITVGSFEEPYEFYWSGDEASTEGPVPTKSSATTAANALKGDSGMAISSSTTTTAASVSSIDDDGMEEMMLGEKRHQPAVIAPIGSEAALVGTKEKKRPDSLRLTCPKPLVEDYVAISPGEIIKDPFGKENSTDESLAAAMSYLPPNNFDVDKFIHSLPPMPVNHDQILHSLRNPLRTPIAPPSAVNAEPSTADSPLFTPIHLGKNPWSYRLPENTWAYP